MPQFGGTPSTSSRSGTDDDPDDIDAVLKRFDPDAWPSNPPTSGAEKAYVRDAYYVVKPAGKATRQDVQQAVYDGKIMNVYRSAGAWYSTACDPFLRYLPHIRPPETAGGAWTYDPDADGSDRPAVPDDPSHPTDDAVDAALDAYDFPEPNADPHLAVRNRLGVQRAFETLQEQRVARSDDLKDGYTLVNVDIDGLFDTRGRWWAAVGRPALASLPWTDPPRVIGRPWRYIGTGANDDDVDTGTADA